MLFGAHMSIAGGVDRAVDRAVDAGCETLQIFTKSNQQWAARRLTEAEIAAFHRKRREHGLDPAIGHTSYLLNLASGSAELWRRSCEACAVELRRSAALGLAGLVLHPGAHGGDGEEAGLARLARGLESVFRRVPEGPPILLECTAGQGTVLGHRLDHLRWVLDRFDRAQLGVCLDTCHLHAAGYRLDSAAAVAATLDRIEATLGFEPVAALHLNDSKGAAGERRDRHAGIGEGTIGTPGFRALVNDPRLTGTPGILETPKGDDGSLDRINLTRLRALRRERRQHARSVPREIGA